jgi:hypothetical protein
MINRNEDSGDSCGTILLMALFFAFMLFSSAKSNDLSYNTIPYCLHFELSSEFPAGNINAVIELPLQFPSVQKSCFQILYNTAHILFNESQKILINNRRITLIHLSLLKSQLLIKPEPLCRFFLPRMPSDTGDLPVLS